MQPGDIKCNICATVTNPGEGDQTCRVCKKVLIGNAEGAGVGDGYGNGKEEGYAAEEGEGAAEEGYVPVDDGARTFTGFLGTIARKPHMCPIRFLNWKAMPEEFKEECWRLVKRKYSVPADPVAYAALKTFTLQKIGKAWRDHKSRLKKQHYIPDSRNKARVKNKDNTGCIKQDWEILVDHWYTDDAVRIFLSFHTCRSCRLALRACVYLFFPDKTPKSNGKNDHRTCCLLGERRLITPVPPKAPPSPLLTWYDLNAQCEYHMQGRGHWTYGCYYLKHKIQDLIDQDLWSPCEDEKSSPED
nr:hypothetical protein CFP56_43312 [Quercus suber]